MLIFVKVSELKPEEIANRKVECKCKKCGNVDTNSLYMIQNEKVINNGKNIDMYFEYVCKDCLPIDILTYDCDTYYPMREVMIYAGMFAMMLKEEGFSYKEIYESITESARKVGINPEC